MFLFSIKTRSKTISNTSFRNKYKTSETDNIVSNWNFYFCRFKYKDEYEKFKLIVNFIGLFISSLNIFFSSRYVYQRVYF
jgi:hypothetical protein